MTPINQIIMKYKQMSIKRASIALFFCLSVIRSHAQSAALSYLNDFSDSTVGMMENYFREIQDVCRGEDAQLWGRPLYGPILLVEPQTRKLFANRPDSLGLLLPYRSIYAGILPKNVGLGNTATEWSGIKWTMVILPLPNKTDPRINLMVHELFHRVQDSLGLPARNTNNPHLDTRDGRLYLR